MARPLLEAGVEVDIGFADLTGTDGWLHVSWAKNSREAPGEHNHILVNLDCNTTIGSEFIGRCQKLSGVLWSGASMLRVTSRALLGACASVSPSLWSCADMTRSLAYSPQATKTLTSKFAWRTCKGRRRSTNSRLALGSSRRITTGSSGWLLPTTQTQSVTEARQRSSTRAPKTSLGEE